MLESVQRFALKICTKNWHSDYHLCLQQFSLMDLKSRRMYLSLCLFFKLVNDMCDFPDFPTTLFILRDLIIVMVLFYPLHILIITCIYTLLLSGTLYLLQLYLPPPYHCLNVA